MPATITTRPTVHVFDAYPRKGWLAGRMILTSTGREIVHTRLEAPSFAPADAVAEAARLWPDHDVVIAGHGVEMTRYAALDTVAQAVAGRPS